MVAFSLSSSYATSKTPGFHQRNMETAKCKILTLFLNLHFYLNDSNQICAFETNVIEAATNALGVMDF